MTTFIRTTTDASSTYREGAAVQVARAHSSADVGNLAAETKDTTFSCGPALPLITEEKPHVQANAAITT